MDYIREHWRLLVGLFVAFILWVSTSFTAVVLASQIPGFLSGILAIGAWLILLLGSYRTYDVMFQQYEWERRIDATPLEDRKHWRWRLQ